MVNIMEALQEIRALARQFAREQLRPNVERWDHDRTIDDDVLAQLAELGFFGMRIPENYGGMEFDMPTYLTAIEELAWGEPAVALLVARGAVVADLLLRHGSDAQKQRWLERLASGDVIGAAALPEGTAGIVARSAGDEWLLDGTHSFAVAADADLRVVPARADGRTVLFLLPPGSAQTGDRDSTMGFRPLEFNALTVSGLRVSSDAVLEAPDADTVAKGTDLGRMSMAAVALGIAQAALDHAVAYADEREQFGQKLRTFEGMQIKLADMALRVHASRALLAAAAGSPSAAATAMAKVFASEAAMWVTTQAVQVFGGYGYMRDYPVEKLMRDAKGVEILEGVNEALRVRVALGMYGGDAGV
jgi:alkylation response protein AidB-like acyl-CoA dehydrogenase